MVSDLLSARPVRMRSQCSLTPSDSHPSHPLDDDLLARFEGMGTFATRAIRAGDQDRQRHPSTCAVLPVTVTDRPSQCQGRIDETV
jgi:hypothetical protein